MLLAGVAALSGALSAWLAHQRMALYNDAVRPVAGRPIPPAKAVGMSAPTMWRMGMPVSFLLGVPLVHVLLLGADVIGTVLTRRGAVVVVAGALYGAAAFTLITGFSGWLLAHPQALTAIGSLGLVAGLAYPLIPALAVYRLGGRVVGAPVLVAVVAVIFGTAIGAWPLGWHLPAVMTGVALVLLCALGLRSGGAGTGAVVRPQLPLPASRLTGVGRLVLALNAGLLAGLASQGLLAGDALAAALVAGQGDMVGAAMHSLVRTLAFLPTVVGSYWVSGAVATAGVPDWLFAVGYFSPGLAAAVVAGMIALLLETAVLPRVGPWVLGRPRLSEAAQHVRTATGQITDIVFVLGSVLAAHTILAYSAPVVLAVLLAVNEGVGRRVPRLLVAVLGLMVLIMGMHLSGI